ncbi:restriction endonuclease [Streptomyces narbonensis]|uniref:Restriction endonuclease n=1 Tax=Streptomyces narbonensis TaxID=67333 RepID=A0ABV3CGU2_9ACTN
MRTPATPRSACAATLPRACAVAGSRESTRSGSQPRAGTTSGHARQRPGVDVIGRMPDGRKLVVQCQRYAKHRTVGSPDLQKFNGTARSEHGADVPLFVASCKFIKQDRAFAARHGLVLVDVDLLGFWNSGTALTVLLDLDIKRSGTNRKLSPDN